MNFNIQILILYAVLYISYTVHCPSREIGTLETWNIKKLNIHASIWSEMFSELFQNTA